WYKNQIKPARTYLHLAQGNLLLSRHKKDDGYDKI
ncbi:MAG: hypothetical protein ACI977_000625, partial [Candidatus Nanohaloarchaea archaeon]